MRFIVVLALLMLVLVGCQPEEQETGQEQSLEAEQELQVPKALVRCLQYKNDIRRANFYYWGVDFPYWYAIGQAQQESSCRSSVTSFDEGKGLFQFVPATAKEVKQRMKEEVDPTIASDAIRMNAYYMRGLHNQNWSGCLWMTYQAYNGGWGTLKSEYLRAGTSDYECMRQQCKRKKIKLPSGQYLDLCKVNYDYSKKIYEYGDYFRAGSDSIPFWGE